VGGRAEVEVRQPQGARRAIKGFFVHFHCLRCGLLEHFSSFLAHPHFIQIQYRFETDSFCHVAGGFG
jgi:hypothetical protein